VNSKVSWILVVVVVVALMLPLAPMLMIGLVMHHLGCDQTRASVGTAAVHVDPATVPRRSVAGYGRDQLLVAAQIMVTARQLGLTLRDQQIGVMTAMGESSLGGDQSTRRPNGDGDVGVFQLRAHVGWHADGRTLEENIKVLNDVPYAALTFFKGHDVAVKGPNPAGPIGYHIPGLIDIQGRELLEPTIAAHKTQVNADPQHYAKWWDAATKVVAALAGVKPLEGAGGAPTGDGEKPGDTGEAVDRYRLGPVQPHTARLAMLLGPKFGITNIGGHRQDSIPDHPSGLALDFMVNDKRTGDRLADYIVEHIDELGVRYVIWYQRIWNVDRADEGWRPMDDRGSDTQNHKDHVHVTMNEIGGTMDVEATDGDERQNCAHGLTRDSTGSTDQPNSQGWTKPLTGRLSSPFGPRTDPVRGGPGFHGGQDIAASCRTPIHAAKGGVVTESGRVGSYGNLIVIDHGGGVSTAYAHIIDNGLLVSSGDRVSTGAQIGKVGSTGNSTGCHLHFEVRLNGVRVNPTEYLVSVGITL
jgi:hypothetical protein